MLSGWYSEGRQRERIAAYLLGVPPLSRQTRAQKKQTKAMLDRLWHVEVTGVLRSAGKPRRLWHGDVLALVTAVLYSAATLVGKEQRRLSVIVPVQQPAVFTALEPRVLQLGIVALLRDAVKRGHVTAAVELCPGFLELCLQSEQRLFCRGRTLRLAKETARLHKGSLAVNPHSIRLRISTGEQGTALWKMPAVSTLSRSLTAVPVVGLFSLTHPL